MNCIYVSYWYLFTAICMYVCMYVCMSGKVEINPMVYEYTKYKQPRYSENDFIHS